MLNIACLDARLRRQAVCHQLLLIELWHDVLKRRFIEAQYHKSIERYLVSELNERSFDVLQISIAIEMVSLECRQHGNSRRDGKERSIEFIRFYNNEIPLAKTRVC